MKILIFGAGGMGCFLAGVLSIKEEVMLYGRGEKINTVDEKGIKIIGKTNLKAKPQTLSYPENLKDHNFDLIIIAVKAYDTDSALDMVKRIEGGSPVLSLQNGLDNELKISNALGSERALGGVTSHGVTFIEPGHIHHAGLGETIIGEMNGQKTKRIQDIASVLTKAGIETEVSENINREIWAKGIVNAGINPLTALTGLKNGFLLKIPSLTWLLETTCKECLNVARAEGHELDEQEIFEKTKSVARLTAENRSSMLQDMEKGKRTEIDAINGRIVELGKRHGIETPVNSTLVALIRGVEEAGGSLTE
ncbi:MAG: ketopantoate reductase family protein [Thermoplasmata archaeon]|nr:MAG: ketopantoate reductase family protein [Thermoplasmata archaeon]